MKAFDKWWELQAPSQHDNETHRPIGYYAWRAALEWVLSHKETFCTQDLDITMWEIVEQELAEEQCEK